MQKVSDDSPEHIVRFVHDGGRHGLDDCIACRARSAYNLLIGTVEILRPIAIRRRPWCKSAGACVGTGLPFRGSEAPHADNCECFVTQEFAHAVLDIAGQLEVLLERADRLAQMLERSGVGKRSVKSAASSYSVWQANLHRLSARERAEQSDLLIVMRAMADPKKTAAIYFAMSQATRERDGRPCQTRN